jgi:rhamnose transport system permease protein
MYVFRGLTFFISGGQWVNMMSLLEDFRDFSQGTSIGISNLIWITIVVYIFVFILLKWLRLGRQIYATGSNPEAATISGIRTDRVKLFAYAFNGALAGLAGAMFVGFYAGAQNNIALGLELDIIAACVIGGVSLRGGQGTLPGVLLGALMIAVINRSLSLVGIDPFWQQSLKGAIILVAIMANIWMQRQAVRQNLEKREI